MLEADQWYSAEPLPIECAIMTSVTIADTCYILGGNDSSFRATKTVLCASIISLIEQAASSSKLSTSTPCQDAIRSSAWKMLPDTPLNYSTAASLGGCLLAIGGKNDQGQRSPAVHMFLFHTNSWVRITSSDLPAALSNVTAIEIHNSILLVCGGFDTDSKKTKTVHMGSITL